MKQAVFFLILSTFFFTSCREYSNQTFKKTWVESKKSMKELKKQQWATINEDKESMEDEKQKSEPIWQLVEWKDDTVDDKNKIEQIEKLADYLFAENSEETAAVTDFDTGKVNADMVVPDSGTLKEASDQVASDSNTDKEISE